MCEHDRMPMIWKKKANEIFALTAKDVDDVECRVVNGTGWMRYKETHLMKRKIVLQIALAKHGGSFDAINAAFVARKAKKLKSSSKRTL